MGKISDYAEVTSLASGDLLPSLFNNGNGTYTNKKIQAINLPGNIDSLRYTFDGQGFALAALSNADFFYGFAFTITGWTIINENRVGLSDAIVVDVLKGTYANYAAGTVPTSSIAGSELITLTAGASNYAATNATIASWTKTVSATDVLRFHINSAAILTKVMIALSIKRTT